MDLMIDILGAGVALGLMPETPEEQQLFGHLEKQGRVPTREAARAFFAALPAQAAWQLCELLESASCGDAECIPCARTNGAYVDALARGTAAARNKQLLTSGGAAFGSAFAVSVLAHSLSEMCQLPPEPTHDC